MNQCRPYRGFWIQARPAMLGGIKVRWWSSFDPPQTRRVTGYGAAWEVARREIDHRCAYEAEAVFDRTAEIVRQQQTGGQQP